MLCCVKDESMDVNETRMLRVNEQRMYVIKKLSEKNTSAATESELQYFHTTLIRIAPPKCSVLLGFKKIAWAGREISMTWAD